METVVLRGGSRDGESAQVAEGVRRRMAASVAPGLIDVYEADGETEQLHDGGTAQVLAFVGQEPVGDTAPEMLHPPQQAHDH